MDYRLISQTNLQISTIGLGTWAFGSDRWWGHQERKDSEAVMERALELGVTTWDTAPVYGRGVSEQVVGDYLAKTGKREKVVLATKVGLSWDNRRVYHDLKPERMREEIEVSRKNLKTDVIDIYQLHWPDTETPIQETAQTMREFFEKGWIRAIGVSNFSVAQAEEFMRYAPLHFMQSPYNLFRREIETELLPFCRKHQIAVLAYQPLASGILTGKFHLEGKRAPKDFNRSRHPDLSPERFALVSEKLQAFKSIADKYGKSLTQLALQWVMSQQGMTSALAGARKPAQLEENAGAAGWQLQDEDRAAMDKILSMR